MKNLKYFFLLLGLWLATSLPITDGNSAQEEKRYDQLTSIVAHNSYTNKKAGWHRYRQQNLTVKEQLEHGARGLTFDIHSLKNEIKLCHNKCLGPFGFQRDFISGLKTMAGYDPGYQRFKDVLKIINDWLDQPKNRNVIVTLFIKINFHYPDADYRLATDEFHINQKIFKPEYKQNNNNQWQTLKWMRDNNKRIVIFYEDKWNPPHTQDLTNMFYAWNHIIESHYGETERPQDICIQRKESKKICLKKFGALCKNRKLLMLNFFDHPASESRAKSVNSYASLRKAISDCKSHNFFQNKKPNFITLDFVDHGDAIRLMHNLNTSENLTDFITNFKPEAKVTNKKPKSSLWWRTASALHRYWRHRR